MVSGHAKATFARWVGSIPALEVWLGGFMGEETRSQASGLAQQRSFGTQTNTNDLEILFGILIFWYYLSKHLHTL